MYGKHHILYNTLLASAKANKCTFWQLEATVEPVCVLGPPSALMWPWASLLLLPAAGGPVHICHVLTAVKKLVYPSVICISFSSWHSDEYISCVLTSTVCFLLRLNNVIVVDPNDQGLHPTSLECT